MKKIFRISALLLLTAFLSSSCSMLTAQGRRERAYEHYVNKMSKGRVKQQKRFASRGNTMPVMHDSASIMASEGSGPVSVSDGSGQ